MRARSIVAVLAALTTAGLAVGASNVDPNRKVAWSENCGWLNWRDAGDPDSAQGVQLAANNHLTGFIWGENIGWINTGNGGPYLNTNNTNYGVNYNSGTGALTGYAWSENCGWINFSGGALASPPNPARIENGRLRGFAWGENIGWINLDDNTDKYVRVPPCYGDANNDGIVDFNDVVAVLGSWLTNYTAEPGATGFGDANFDGVVDFNDIVTVLGNWLVNCA